jgi:hypothetical protein
MENWKTGSPFFVLNQDFKRLEKIYFDSNNYQFNHDNRLESWFKQLLHRLQTDERIATQGTMPLAL